MSTGKASSSQIIKENLVQAQDFYTAEEFVRQILHLSQLSILYHCPHTQERLIQIYYAFCDQMNTQKMDRQSIKEFIQVQKNQNRKSLSKEVRYYQKQFSKKVNQNRLILTKTQFKKLLNQALGKFIEEKNQTNIITEILIEKSKKSEFFSCLKVQEMLKDISNEIQQYDQPSLSPEKLILDRRISTKPEVLKDGDQLIFNQMHMALMNDPILKLQNYFSYWSRIVSFLTEFIPDDSAREQAEDLLQKFKIHQADIQQDYKFLFQKNQEVENQCRELQQAFQRMKLQKQIFQQADLDYKNRIYELNDIITKIQKQNKEKMQKIDQIQNQMEFSTKELQHMQRQCVEMQMELKDERTRYQVLQKEYQKVIQENNIKSAIKKQPVIFQERTLKQKLSDAQYRLNRFLKQIEAEKKVTAEKLQQRDTTIQLLQVKVAELQAEVINNNKKTEDLKDYRIPSKIFNFRNSILNGRDSYMSDRNAGSLIMRGSAMMNSAIKMNKNIKQQINGQNNLNKRASVFLGQEQLNKATNRSKIKSMNIAADYLPQIQEENTNAFDISHLPPEPQLVQAINSIVQQDLNKSFTKKDAKVKVEHAESTVPSKQDDLVIPQNFISKGVLINVFGVKYQVTLLLTYKRFCYLDIKSRLVRYLPIQNIKSFVFCKQNSTLFILRPKNVTALNPKKYIVNPMIFSIRNRDKMAHHLTTKLSKQIKQNQIELFTKLQDDIFLNIDQQEINIKHKIPKMNNPYRLALSDQPVFYVKLQEEGLLTFKDKAILVIQPMGLLCFKGEQTYQFQQKQQLLYFLPFNNCIMSERQNSREAPGRKLKLIYQTQIQKYFNLIFNTKEELKLFLQKCKQQQSKNKNQKTIINQNLEAMFKK